MGDNGSIWFPHVRRDIRTLAATPACAPIDHGLLIRPIWLHVVVTLLHRIFRHPLYLSDFPEITGAATGGIIRRWEERDGFDIGVHAGIKQVVGSILVFARIYLVIPRVKKWIALFVVMRTVCVPDSNNSLRHIVYIRCSLHNHRH